MTLSRRQIAALWVGCVAAAMAAGLVIGRRSVPEKVRVDTKIEYVDRVVEKVVTVKAQDKKKQTTTRTETKPDGSSVTLKVENVQTHANLGTVSDFTGTSAGTLSSSAETERGANPGWRLGAGVEWNGVHERPDAYRIEVDRRVVGPFWLGVRAGSDRTAGAVVSVEW